MFTGLWKLGGLLWGQVTVKSSEEEDFESQLKKLEEEENEEKFKSTPIITEVFSECVKRQGVVTNLDAKGGYIDNKYYFPLEISQVDLKVNDEVAYLSYQKYANEPLKVIRIITKEEYSWEPYKKDKIMTESSDCVLTHCATDERVLIGKVIKKEGRNITLEPNNVKINLDSVVSNFLPMLGDWVEAQAKVQVEFDSTGKCEVGEVLQVHSICCLRTKTLHGRITQWDPKKAAGIVSNLIFVPSTAWETGYSPKINDEVVVDAIESDQGKLTWRAITVAYISVLAVPAFSGVPVKKTSNTFNKNGIIISENVCFGSIPIHKSKDLTVSVLNSNSFPQKLLRAKFHSKKFESQLVLIKGIEGPYVLKPSEELHFTFTCTAKFLGSSEETFVFTFEHFSISRLFKILVEDPSWYNKNFGLNSDHFDSKKRYKIFAKNLHDKNGVALIPGIPLVKPPTFVKVKLPLYPIPACVMTKLIECYNLDNSLSVFDNFFPFTLKSLNMNTYLEKFHTLLFCEEFDRKMNIQKYNLKSAFMSKSHPYLTLEVEGLSEKRPSLIIGDNVLVKNPWSADALEYQGYIHKISSNILYLLFCNDFHMKYAGEDVSVEFNCSRGIFSKFHQAIELVYMHLGREILFPDSLKTRSSQIEICDDIKELKSDKNSQLTSLKERIILWNNKNLNKTQKEAIKNILYGISRPLPYVIFGPPGTGKTITIVETVLQLICLIPESRILIATPSNSSANVLAERLIDCANIKPGFLVRLLAHYVAISGNLPDKLKPYCATVDISLETTNRLNSTYEVSDDGIKFNCPRSVIGRHRITIGTCSCLGSLFRLGLPKGHFTHVIVDEAGQAIEPEVMIPLSMVNKEDGQIILAGDPMQLGPTVISKPADQHGLGDSYLERLLKCFPYQKDIEGFGHKNGGFDPRVVTRLVCNYRSIPKILSLPSKMFYDDCLISQINPASGWVGKDVKTLHSLIFDSVKDFQPDSYPGVVFNGIRGINYRGLDSPSWYNLHEASMVMMFTCKLYKNGFNAEDIGIISPYIQQVKQIYTLFNDMGMESPKISSVEEFQGQERKIIILSTVRSSDALVQSDLNYSLGFVKNPKRLNVAITRAKILMIIFGNPHLLCMDPSWRQVIQYAVDNESYMGCNLPDCFKSD